MLPNNRSRRLSLETLESRQMLTITVTTLADVFTGQRFGDNVSLRDALYFTNNDADTEIDFDPSLSGGTITLNSHLEILRDVTILGPGADKLTITTNGNQRLFSVAEGFRALPTVELRGLKLTGADTAQKGGAVFAIGANLVIRDCWITGNESANNGGGVAAQQGVENPGPWSVTVINSTISGNSSAKSGGGISTGGVNFNLINSTVSGNAADDQGGGLHVASGIVKVVNSTIARNRANSDGTDDPGTDSGGGISRAGGNVRLDNSLVLGNYRGTGTALNDIDGNLAPGSSRNIIGHANSSGGLANGPLGNLVGNNGTGARNVGTVLVPTLQSNQGVMPTHALVANSPAIDSGVNGLAKNQNGQLLTTDQRGISRNVDGDLNGSKIVDRGAFELARPPVLSLSGTLNFREQNAPQVLSTTANVSDVDTRRFNGGRLTVLISGALGTDRLAIRNQGNAAGKIGVQGSQVKFGGMLIGTFLGGTGINSLRVNLNNNSTIGAVRALLRNITFQNVADAPPTHNRIVRFILTDDSGMSSAPKQKTVKIIPVNDRPVIQANSGGGTFLNNQGGPQRMGPVVSDPDSVNFAGGRLTVQLFQNVESTDRLGFSAGFIRQGNQVKKNNVVIGTVSGGNGTTPLIVNFNGKATNSLVVELVRNITFDIGDRQEEELDRKIRFTLTDGDGGTSNAPAFTIHPIFIRG